VTFGLPDHVAAAIANAVYLDTPFLEVDDDAEFIPTPQQIAAGTLAIRAGWSPATYEERTVVKLVSTWTVPQVKKSRRPR